MGRTARADAEAFIEAVASESDRRRDARVAPYKARRENLSAALTAATTTGQTATHTR